MSKSFRTKIVSGLFFVLLISGCATISMDAVRNNDIAVVRNAIEKGAKVNAKNKDDLTALMVASGEGHTEIVSALIKAGADVNAKNEAGSTALMFASWKGHTETVSALIEAGADVNVKEKDGFTALMMAAGNGHAETVSALIEAGADVNAKNDNGQTTLMGAAQEGHTKIVSTLIKAGADVNAKSKDGLTALMTAVANNSYEIAKLLISKGADVNAENKDGKTVLRFLVSPIINAGVSDLSFEEAESLTTSQNEAVGNYQKMEKLLKSHGAKIYVEKKKTGKNDGGNNVSVNKVKFLKKFYNGNFTYEVYRAPDEESANLFLKSKKVTKQYYYIEVETPTGVFCKDIQGEYYIPPSTRRP